MTNVPYTLGQLSCVGTSQVVSNRLLTCNRWFDSTTCLLTQSGLFTVAIVLLLACDDQLFFYSIATLLSVCMHTLNSTLQFHTLHTYVHTHYLRMCSHTWYFRGHHIHIIFHLHTHYVYVHTHNVHACHVHTPHVRMYVHTYKPLILCTYSPYLTVQENRWVEN